MQTRTTGLKDLDTMQHHRLALAAAALLAGLSAGCATRGANSEAALFADLDAGWHVAGIPLDKWEDVPGEEEFQRRPMAGRAGSYRKDLEAKVVRLEGIRSGDFQDLQVFFRTLTRWRSTEEMVKNPEADAMYDETACLGVLAKPRWADPGQAPASGPVNGRDAAPPPRPPGAAAQLARFGLSLGEVVALDFERGPIFKTSKRGWYVILEPGGPGAGPQLSTIVRRFESEWFEDGKRQTLGEVAKQLASLGSAGKAGELERFKQAIADCAGKGEVDPRTIYAALEEDAVRYAAPSMNQLAARFESAPMAERFKLVNDLALQAWGASRRFGEAPPPVVAALRRWLEMLRADLTRAAEEARGGGRPYPAETFAVVARLLGEQPVLKEPAVPMWEKHLTGLPGILENWPWLAGKGDVFTGKSLLEKLEAQHQLALEPDPPKSVAPHFLAAVRNLLADEYEAAARQSAARGLHATACARYLLAHGLRAGGKPEAPQTRNLHYLAAHGGGGEDPFSSARWEALQLAKLFLPLVDPEAGAGAACAEAYEQNALFASTPIAIRLGMTTCALSRAHFAQVLQAPLLRIEFEPAVIQEISSTVRTESEKKMSYRSAVVSNKEAVEAWRDRLNNIEREIHVMSAELDDALKRPSETENRMAIRGVNPSDLNKIHVSEGNRDQLTARIELGQALDHQAREFNRRDALEALRDKLKKEGPPPNTVTKTLQDPYTITRRIQEWKIRHTVKARLTGGKTPFERNDEYQATPTYTRVHGDPQHGVQAVDEWRTEADLRADPELFRPSKFAPFVLRAYVEAGLSAYEAELSKRELTELERATEQDWLRYFFTRQDPDRKEPSPQEEVIGFACGKAS